MAQKHDYADAGVEARLKGNADAAAILKALDALPPFEIAIPAGQAFLDLSKNDEIRQAVEKLLPAPAQASPKQKTPALFATSYELKTGTHVMAVRGGSNQSFTLTCIVFPEGGTADDAAAEDKAFDAFLGTVRKGGDITQIASDAFLRNHVLERSEISGLDQQDSTKFDSALRSVMRGKATSVIVLDAAAKQGLADEVIDLTLAHKYSNSGQYTSRSSFLTFDLDPQSKEIRQLTGTFKYSVYHEKADGLWRISHYEGIGPDAKLIKQTKAPQVLSTLSDHTQTAAHKLAQKENQKALDTATTALRGFDKTIKEGPGDPASVEKKLERIRGNIATYQGQLDDYEGYVAAFEKNKPEKTKEGAKPSEPLSREVIQALLQRQQDAYKETVKTAEDTAEKYKQAEEALKDRPSLVGNIAALTEKAANPPNRFQDWLAKLDKLSVGANAVATAMHADNPEKMPEGWAKRFEKVDK